MDAVCIIIGGCKRLDCHRVKLAIADRCLAEMG
jgi:hypothetical protein